MAFITQSTIQEVNNRLDAVSVIGEYLRLDKKSGRWWGKCPFHAGGQEKTPSFKVDPDLKTYHCFGCNKSGSVISFIMEMDGLSYPETIKHLARKMGIEIVYEADHNTNIEDTTKKDELFELYKRLTDTFIHFFKEKQEGDIAKKYLKTRGISDQMIETFKLGYAPANKDFLYGFLKKKGYSDEFLEKSGLFSKNYKTFPLFQGRLIFPITDRQGKIVAFGGRKLTSENDPSPKYINSPETEIYKKGQTLYAIDLAKDQMRKTKTVVLAEGYMDVISLHQAGITNAVAPLGTAFTEEQANWLSRWVEKAILIFDTDEAGVKAAFKTILICRKAGINCEVVDMIGALKEATNLTNFEQFKDPADILLKFGENILKSVLKSIIFDFEYILKLPVEKSNFGEYLFPYLDVLGSEIERDNYISQIAEFWRVDKKAVQKDYNNRKMKMTSRISQVDKATNTEKTNVLTYVKRNYELIALTVTAVNMDLYSEIRSLIEISEIKDKAAKELFISLEECFALGQMNMDSLLARINDEALKRFIITNGDTPEFKGSNAKKLMEDGVKEIKKKKFQKRLTEIASEIRLLERSLNNNPEGINAIDELLSEKKHLDMQIRKFEEK